MTRAERLAIAFIAVALIVGASISLWPMFVRPHPHLREFDSACLSNLKQLSIGLGIYQEDNGGMLPPKKWMTALLPVVKTRDMMECPYYRQVRGGGYALNSDLVGKSGWGVEEPSRTNLLFEFDGTGPNSVADFSKRAENRHNGYSAIAYLDTHVKILKGDLAK